jgi:hypothetical protein
MTSETKTKSKIKRKEPASASASASSSSAQAAPVMSLEEDPDVQETTAKKIKPAVPFRELRLEESPAPWDPAWGDAFVGSRIEILSYDGLMTMRANERKPVKKRKALIPETLLGKVTVVRGSSVHRLVLRDEFPSCDTLCQLFATHFIPLDELAICEEFVSGGGASSRTASFVWVLRAFWQNDKDKIVRRDFRVTEPPYSNVFDNNPDSPYGQLIDVFDPSNPLTRACTNLLFKSVRGDRITEAEPGEHLTSALRCGNKWSITCNGSTKHMDIPVIPSCFYDRILSGLKTATYRRQFVKEVWEVSGDITDVQAKSFLMEPQPLEVVVYDREPGRTDADKHYWVEDPELDLDATGDDIKNSLDFADRLEEKQSKEAATTAKTASGKNSVSWSKAMFADVVPIDNRRAIAEAARLALYEPLDESEQKKNDDEFEVKLVNHVLSAQKRAEMDSDLRSVLTVLRKTTATRTNGEVTSKRLGATNANDVEMALAALAKYSMASLDWSSAEAIMVKKLTEFGVMLKYRAAQLSKSMHPLQLPLDEIEGVLAMVNTGALTTLEIIPWYNLLGPLLLFNPISLRRDDAKDNPALAELYTALRGKINTIASCGTPGVYSDILKRTGLADVIKDVPVVLPPNTKLDPRLAAPGLSQTLKQRMTAIRLDEAASALLDLGSAAGKRRQILEDKQQQEEKDRERREQERRDREEAERINRFLAESSLCEHSVPIGARAGEQTEVEDEIERILSGSDDMVVSSAKVDGDGDVVMK